MLNLFSAENPAENNFTDEQIRTVTHALRREGKAQEVIYHTENKESFRYVITTTITNDTNKKLIQTATSVDKFRLQEDEYLEFVQDTLDGGLVREKRYTLPLQEDTDQACQECLYPVAVKHLRCISKIERLLSTPRPRPVVKNPSNRTTLFLFALLIALIGVGLYTFRPLFTNKDSAHLTLLFNTVDVRVWLGTKEYTSKGNRLELNLPLGRYRLQAEKDGFKPARQDIFLTADEEVGIRLEELHTLTIYADMEESRVLLNGNVVGKAGSATPLVLPLTNGDYNLTLTHPSAPASFQKKIHLETNQTIQAELPGPRLKIHFNTDNVIITIAEKEYQVNNKKLELKLPVGTYQVIARKLGYTPVVQDITIEDQDLDVPITMEMIRYKLSITSNVPKTSISVSCTNDEKQFGVASPDAPFLVNTGAESCQVLAENQGYQPVTKDVSLETDMQLSITLKQLFLITIYTNLDMSTVFLDGKEVGIAGTKNPAVLSIPDGSYDITVSNEQAATSVEQKLQVKKDQRLNIDLPLPKLTIKVNIAGATLLVDGTEHQVTGKQLTLVLPQGNHRITAKKEGYITLHREVLVRDGGQTFFKLLPPLYPLSIRSNIDKTVIYVKCKDQKEYSGLSSPEIPFEFEAAAGTCTISTDRKGYKKLTKTVTLPAEKEITLQLVAEVEKKKLTPSATKKIQKKPIPKTPTEQQPEQAKQQPETEEEKPASVQLKAEKKGCQNELSVGMPELCD